MFNIQIDLEKLGPKSLSALYAALLEIEAITKADDELHREIYVIRQCVSWYRSFMGDCDQWNPLAERKD